MRSRVLGQSIDLAFEFCSSLFLFIFLSFFQCTNKNMVLAPSQHRFIALCSITTSAMHHITQRQLYVCLNQCPVINWLTLACKCIRSPYHRLTSRKGVHLFRYILSWMRTPILLLFAHAYYAFLFKWTWMRTPWCPHLVLIAICRQNA